MSAQPATATTEEPVLDGPEGAPGQSISELILAEGAQRVTIPWSGNKYVCPGCEEPIDNRRIIYLGKPAKYAHMLNDVIKCPRSTCRFIFSPRSEAVVIRE